VSEGGGKVVEELLQVGVVLLVPLAWVKRLCNSKATARPSGGGNGAHRRRGPAIPVEEIGIGLLGELWWVAGVLFVLGIREGEQRWWLSTVARDGGGSGERLSSGEEDVVD
jgi:hypothetical protein